MAFLLLHNYTDFIEIFIRFFYFFQTLLKNKMVLAKKALKSTLLKTKK
ncbi:hypothetical protein UKU_00650 [Enterococcus faecalis EnGen0297]|nr:hypothetical protein UKU_00650 [Enterococcus faecalis EnGen0297]